MSDKWMKDQDARKYRVVELTVSSMLREAKALRMAMGGLSESECRKVPRIAEDVAFYRDRIVLSDIGLPASVETGPGEKVLSLSLPCGWLRGVIVAAINERIVTHLSEMAEKVEQA